MNSLDNKSAKTASEILLDNKDQSRDDTSDSLVNDCKIYKKKGCRIVNGEELMRLWKLGNAMILHSNESMVSYTDAVTICGNARALCKISDVKQSGYDTLKKSLSCQLRSKNRRDL